MPSPDVLGQRIRSARNRAGLALEDLAEAVGVPRETVANWESGRNIPVAENRAGLAEALDVDEAVLFGRLRRS